MPVGNPPFLARRTCDGPYDHKEDIMRNRYEILLLFNPELGSEGRQELLDTLSSIIAGDGGEIHTVDDWGSRELAYPVKKHTRGVYVRLEFTVSAQIVAELERNIRISDGVFKFITVRLDEDEAVTAPVGDASGEEE